MCLKPAFLTPPSQLSPIEVPKADEGGVARWGKHVLCERDPIENACIPSVGARLTRQSNAPSSGLRPASPPQKAWGRRRSIETLCRQFPPTVRNASHARDRVALRRRGIPRPPAAVPAAFHPRWESMMRYAPRAIVSSNDYPSRNRMDLSQQALEFRPAVVPFCRPLGLPNRGE